MIPSGMLKLGVFWNDCGCHWWIFVGKDIFLILLFLNSTITKGSNQWQL